MGMFDWYIPVPNLDCPNCSSALKDWQGKDADCVLFVWKQGFAYPITQNADDSNCSEDIRKQARLPKAFIIYTECENCLDYWIEAKCKTENEIWTKIIELELKQKHRLPRKWFA